MLNLLTLLTLILGVLIGMVIQYMMKDKVWKASEKVRKSQDELIEEYELYCKYLKDSIDIYKDAMNATIDENIYLKKKLKGM